MLKKLKAFLLIFIYSSCQIATAFEFQPAFIKAIPVSISPINKIPLNVIPIPPLAERDQFTQQTYVRQSSISLGLIEENRLIYANNPAHTSIIYLYDALNRRISKTVDGNSIFYIHDGDQIVEERDASGNLNATFLYGNGIDEILAMFRGGNLYAYHHDALGSVDAIVDWAGNPAEFTLYDVYGNPSTTNSSIGNPFLFTGRQYDPETGLYYYRNRMYDPTLGRFLQRDPIGYADSMNLYSYVVNDPVNWVDPMGLYFESPSDYASWQLSLYFFSTQPNLVSGASLIYDTIALGVPVIPGAGGYAQAASKGLGAAVRKMSSSVCEIKTPFGNAVQSSNKAALAAKEAISEGTKIFRGGKLGISNASEAQFWALTSPLTKGFAKKYGVPSKNTPFEFIIGGSLKAGESFITRSAPAVGKNSGNAIEAVTNPNSVKLDFFYMP